MSIKQVKSKFGCWIKVSLGCRALDLNSPYFIQHWVFLTSIV